MKEKQEPKEPVIQEQPKKDKYPTNPSLLSYRELGNDNETIDT